MYINGGNALEVVVEFWVFLLQLLHNTFSNSKHFWPGGEAPSVEEI